MSDKEFRDWFETLWTDREDRVYRSIFGDLGPGVFTAGEKVFERYGKDVHPGWLNHGVFACPPHEERESWIYVTSGLSNPWNLEKPGKDPSGFSGLGFELVVESAKESDWAVPLLHNLMAYELLVAVGTYDGAELFEYGNRIPLNESITPSFESQIRWLLVEKASHYPSSFELASGQVDLFHLVGATDPEVEVARSKDQDALLELLKAKGIHPRTDADRESAC
jgi:hypothetical protein